MTADQLITATTWLFNVERAALLGRSRVSRVVEARQALAWALRQSDWTLESIGDLLHKDHTTIMYSIKAVERRAKRDTRLAERLKVLAPIADPPIDWQARCTALEARVAELEALLQKGQDNGRQSPLPTGCEVR
jgi:hypothetical protein